jgi:mono/diheme cytochrome c family protein
VRHTVITIIAALALSTTAAAQDKATIAHGEKVFASQKCTMCHSIAGKGNAKGPLDNAGRLSDEDLRQWMLAPRVMAEKSKSTRKPIMPEYTKLPKEDLDALIAFMKTLKKP